MNSSSTCIVRNKIDLDRQKLLAYTNYSLTELLSENVKSVCLKSENFYSNEFVYKQILRSNVILYFEGQFIGPLS